MEILVAIAILAIIGGLTFSSFSIYKNRENVRSVSLKIVAMLEEARSKTLASTGQEQYGVRIEENSAVMFSGSSYSALNEVGSSVTFITGVNATTTLSASITDVVFNRLSGETDNYGTVTISSNTETASSTIVIYKTGIVEI